MREHDLFLRIHSELPREGPGDRASTLRALGAARQTTRVDAILDIGCGPGAQTIDLASAAPARILAIDTNRSYLEQLSARVLRERVSDRVQPVQASMTAIPLAPESVDVVWAEGSIYLIGFERGLREWKTLVRRGGCIAVTHLSWLTANAPEEPRSFWRLHFPAMATVNDNLAIAARTGYSLLDSFTLPESAWWDDYYGPLEQRLRLLRTEHRDEEGLAIIERTQEQIDLYRRFAAHYGYVFYVLQRAA